MSNRATAISIVGIICGMFFPFRWWITGSDPLLAPIGAVVTLVIVMFWIVSDVRANSRKVLL